MKRKGNKTFNKNAYDFNFKTSAIELNLHAASNIGLSESKCLGYCHSFMIHRLTGRTQDGNV